MAEHKSARVRLRAGHQQFRRMSRRSFALACVAALALLAVLALKLSAGGGRPFAKIVIGSKQFPEPIILGEMIKFLALGAGAELVLHDAALGGTDVVWAALVTQRIDIYVEYEATLRYDIMGGATDKQINARLAERGIKRTDSLGFQNRYGLGMSADRAADLGIEKISDLSNHRTLRYGFTDEFLDRPDGWKPLKEHYASRGAVLTPESLPKQYEHDVAYKKLAAGEIDVIDIYTTDAEIVFHKVRLLEDDEDFFRDYTAFLLYRADLDEEVLAALRPLRISESEMRLMNASATRIKPPPAPAPGETRRREDRFVYQKRLRPVAKGFLESKGIATRSESRYRWRSLARNTGEHLFLVVFALVGGLLAALPLALYTAWNGGWVRRAAFWLWLIPPPAALGAMRAIGEIGEWMAWLTVNFFLRSPPQHVIEMIETIPARLEFLGRGAIPAILVLFLYSFSTLLQHISKGLKHMASSSHRPVVALRRALPYLLNGLRHAAPLITGIAILGTIVDAGGYGGWIRAALDPRIDDPGLGLWGVVPAILLTFLVWALFGALLRKVDPEAYRRFSRGENPSGRTAEIDPITSH